MKSEKICWLILVLVFLVLFVGIFKLQVIMGKEQEQRALQNRFRIETIEAKRGEIFDRNREILVSQNGKRKYEIAESQAHLIGYIGEANKEEMSHFGVDIGKAVGKIGIERELNSILMGTDGGIVEEYSAEGERVRTFSKKEAIAGQDVFLTIDKNLQEKAYEKLKENEFLGAVIASTPDGEILALVSYPAFDPNQFVELLTGDDLESQNYVSNLFENESKPLFNRAIGGIYPPASTFKIVSSLAFLEEGVIDENFEIEDKGKVKIGDSTFSNWYYTSYGKTDGMVNIVKALKRSNDIFFYEVSQKLGIEKLAFWAKKLGLGEKTGIILEGESEGLVPDKKWKDENIGEDWYTGDTLITSIGQGNLQTTPMQIQRLMSLVANGGYLCKPRLIFGKNKNCEKVGVSKKNLNIVKKGLELACREGGTAWPLFQFKVKNEKIKIDGVNFIKEASGSADMVRVPVGCKTGTAETGIFEEIDGKEVQKTHAWFTAYAPSQNPEIVVTVFLEEGGQGSDLSAKIARDILREWFEEK